MRKIDGKYVTTGELTKVDGTPIPEDEPLILFRGKDKLLPGLLDHYAKLCREAGSPPQQYQGISQKADEIRRWQSNNQERVKVPD